MSIDRRRTLHRVAAVVGVGHTDWAADYQRVRAGEKPHDSYGYAARAFVAALGDAGLSRDDVDGLIVSSGLAHERTSEILGLNPRWGAQSDAANAVIQGCMAIACGLASVVALVYGNDQRSAKVSYGGADTMGGNMVLSYIYHAPWGMTSQGALYAMMFRRYMELTGCTEAQLGEVAVAQRQAAALNPFAIMRKPLTRDDYLASHYVCEPLRLPDYCLVNDGGVALIITDIERASRLTKPAVAVHGVGRYDLNVNATSMAPRLIDFYRTAQKAAAHQVFNMASIEPDDVDCLQIYDSFSVHVPLALEGYGYCDEGDAGRFMSEEGISLAGKLPVNTSGGHLSEAYMQGWNHQVEAVRQIRGECADRQVKDCRFVHYGSDVAGKACSIIYGR
jgi:acetyl-CoA acetyltransferase